MCRRIICIVMFFVFVCVDISWSSSNARDVQTHTIAPMILKDTFVWKYTNDQKELTEFLSEVKGLDVQETRRTVYRGKSVGITIYNLLSDIIFYCARKLVDISPSGFCARGIYAGFLFMSFLRNSPPRDAWLFLRKLFWLPRSVKNALKGKEVIWINGPGIGEWNMAMPVIKQLETMYPEKKFLLSCSNVFSLRYVKKCFPDYSVVLTPYDMPLMLRFYLKGFNVKMLLMIEAPWMISGNCVNEVKRQGGVTMIFNANVPVPLKINRAGAGLIPRIMDKAFVSPKTHKPTNTAYTNVDLVMAQSDNEVDALQKKGVPEDGITVTGNIKFDGGVLGTEKAENLHEVLGLTETTPVIVAGSTHRGEHELIIDVFTQVKKKYPDAILLIAPRRMEDVLYIENSVPVSMSCSRKSKLLTGVDGEKDLYDVVIIDTMGELQQLYALASVAVIGGSFQDVHGGHSILEPAHFKKPIICGHNMEHFQDIRDKFVRENAVVQVESEEAFYYAVDTILSQQHIREMLGGNAFEVVRKNTGALNRTINCIAQLSGDYGMHGDDAFMFESVYSVNKNDSLAVDTGYYDARMLVAA